MNYSNFLNPTSLTRKPSAIRILSALVMQAGPSMISMAGGMPNAATFPFKEASFKMWNGDTLKFSEDRMKLALQYSASTGIPDFLRTLCHVQNSWHSGGPGDRFKTDNLCVTYGSTDGVSKSLDMLLSPGDGVLLEQPTNAHILSALKPLACKLLPIATDQEGIIASDIHKAFDLFNTTDANKETNRDNARRIKCLYINNSLPSTSLQRRKQVLQLAKEKDFLVLEHDPFYFLTHPQKRLPSYLSLDNEGRVLRVDSLSHIFSPGLRIGMVTGAEELVNRVVLHVMVSSMHCPSINQMMVNEVMSGMKIEGFNEFCEILSDHYEVRRNLALKASEEHLSEFFVWEIPETGFSLRLRLKQNCKIDLCEVLKDLEKQKVYFRSGKECYIEDNQEDQLLFSFGLCDEEDINKGCEMLSKTMKERSS